MRNRLFSATNCILLALLSTIVFCGSAEAAEKIAGPVAAELIRVVDGDTVLVSAMPWPNHHVTTYVRLRGIIALRGSPQCRATGAIDPYQPVERLPGRCAH